jgi:hypothetical protein
MIYNTMVSYLRTIDRVLAILCASAKLANRHGSARDRTKAVLCGTPHGSKRPKQVTCTTTETNGCQFHKRTDANSHARYTENVF